ncbi:hypothetical protein NXV03_21125 [Phocaeicola vulgatus]|nr:hypothetical protein [Phocaeicola vulgatus]
MNKLIIYNFLLLIVVIMSCNSNENIVNDYARISLKLSTRLPEPDSNNENILSNEKLLTLRVILRKDNGPILYNLFFNNVEDGSKKIIFDDLTVKQEGEVFEIIAIANEKTFISDSSNIDGLDINIEQIKNLLLDKDLNNPKMPILPQSAITKVKVGPNESKHLTMQMNFPLNKFKINFFNKTGTDISLTEVKVVSEFSKDGPLFPDLGINSVIPDKHNNLFFGNSGNIVIPQSGTVNIEDAILYTYPFKDTHNECYFSARWNNNIYTQKINIKETKSDSQSLIYGKQYDINVTLLNSMRINIDVKPWDVYNTILEYGTEFEGVLTPGLSNNSIKIYGKDSYKPSIAVALGMDGEKEMQYSTLR